MHGNISFPSMLNLRSADDEPKIATGSFLNVPRMVNRTTDQAMRYPVQIDKRKVSPEVDAKTLSNSRLTFLPSNLPSNVSV